jgi:hypothetical protein
MMHLIEKMAQKWRFFTVRIRTYIRRLTDSSTWLSLSRPSLIASAIPAENAICFNFPSQSTMFVPSLSWQMFGFLKQYKKAPKGASRTTKDSLCRGVGVLEVQPAAHSKGSGLWQRAGVPACSAEEQHVINRSKQRGRRPRQLMKGQIERFK